MTRGEEQTYRAFIKEALEFRHLLNCVLHDPDRTPEEHEECLALRPVSNACVRFAYRLRRKLWREWRKQRQEEQRRKRAAQKRRQEKRKRERGQTR